MALALSLYANKENKNNGVEVYNDWVVVCENNKDKKYCYMSQTLNTQVEEQNLRLLQLSIDKNRSNEYIAKIILPLGVDLRSGISFQTIGKALGTNEIKVDFYTCMKDGCLAIVPLNADFLRSLELGNIAKIGFNPFNSDKTAVLEISLNGFSKAKEQL